MTNLKTLVQTPDAEPAELPFVPGRKARSTAKAFGDLLAHEIENNRHFYLFSPDETTSNKLDAVYQTSSRAWSDLKTEAWDLPESANGHIVELLSENTLFATMLGHLLSEEPAMMTSYESFFPIITSQLVQHIKFLTQSDKVDWRPKYPAANLLSTSTCWRQDHNGFSHQTPILISTLLSLPSAKVNCFFPVDASSASANFKYLMTSDNVVNLTTFNKTDEPIWQTEEQAIEQAENYGVSVFGFASDGDSKDLDSHMNDIFDLIFTAAGDIATREALYAMKILRQDLPKLRMRFVSVSALTYHAIGTTDKKLDRATFEKIFKARTPIIANFHGYADVFRNILSEYTSTSRLSVHGFEEHGSTTTPFEMLSLNHASRYDLALDAALRLGRIDLADKYRKIITACHTYAESAGVDHKAITDFSW